MARSGEVMGAATTFVEQSSSGSAQWAICGLLLLAQLFSMTGCQKTKEAQTVPPAAPTPHVEVSVVAEKITVLTSAAEFQLAKNGSLTGSLTAGKQSASLDSPTPPASQIILVGKKEYSGVDLDLSKAQIMPTSGKLGPIGKHIEVPGSIPETGVTETLRLDIYDQFPNLILVSLDLHNSGNSDVSLSSILLQRHNFVIPEATSADPHPLWTFQGASLKWGKDEIFPVPAKFSQENPFGAAVATGDDLAAVGGGIPVVAFWNRNIGAAIGHVETLPLTLSIPVKTTAPGQVEAGVRIPAGRVLKPGEDFSTPRTFFTVFAGDFYKPLNLWSEVVAKEGLERPKNNDENYAVSWCGWGYEFGVSPKQMLDTIPKLKELGIHWATLDDGWFSNYGDWQPRAPVFAGAALPDMVRNFHDQGIKLQLWWLPLGVEDGLHGYGGRKFVVSDVVKEHPDWLILNKDGKPARMARNLATLCPAVPEVQAYYKQLTERFIRDWGFDGHKLDNIWSISMCYNPKHHHQSPSDSVNAMGEVYKIIFETTRALKPDSVTQSCPCGTPPNLAWLRYMDQAVTADPVGAIQVRRRIKMYKALLGPNAAVYGDHVELTRLAHANSNEEQDLGKDFASTVGTGGVVGTKFTWPDYGKKFDTVFLNPEKNQHWKKWIALYNEKMLSKGEFLDLYTYGFDFPEAYAIQKDGHYYYAFYVPDSDGAKKQAPSPGKWQGTVQLRGLPAGTFHVMDYVNHQDFGTVTGPTADVNVTFTADLLLEASPVQK
jgi:alpha-galactosidase